MFLTAIVRASFWQSWGLLAARIVVAGVFLMAAWFKFSDIQMTALYIGSVGIPFALLLAWGAAFFELVLGLSFLTGLCMREVSFLAFLYILFLAFTFHGPSHWQGNQTEFGFFIDHFTFAAGLIYMLVFGPGPLAYVKGMRANQN